MKLLEGIIVLDFSQFLSGPSAGLRLADMGAQVIKIEKPDVGDICRQLYVSDTMLNGESTIFHAINRNKQSFAADLKDAQDLLTIKELLVKADVMIHNFRPGVMERIGLDYATVKSINPQIVYGEISGYGEKGPWRNLPGQDLLVQGVSGLTWLSNSTDEPTPMGVAIVDILAGTHLTQGILAALYQRLRTNEGSLVQVSMLESILDFQFEVLTSFYNDGNEVPQRSKINNGHAYIAAPYGIYRTFDGYLALSMGDILVLGDLLDCPPLKQFADPAEWFTKRDSIKEILALCLGTKTTDHWLNVLEAADIWCARVLNYEMMVNEKGYQALNMELIVKTTNGSLIKTTRCPIRIDGELLVSERGAPSLGEHTREISQQFALI